MGNFTYGAKDILANFILLIELKVVKPWKYQTFKYQEEV